MNPASDKIVRIARGLRWTTGPAARVGGATWLCSVIGVFPVVMRPVGAWLGVAT